MSILAKGYNVRYYLELIQQHVSWSLRINIANLIDPSIITKVKLQSFFQIIGLRDIVKAPVYKTYSDVVTHLVIKSRRKTNRKTGDKTIF